MRHQQEWHLVKGKINIETIRHFGTLFTHKMHHKAIENIFKR